MVDFRPQASSVGRSAMGKMLYLILIRVITLALTLVYYIDHLVKEKSRESLQRYFSPKCGWLVVALTTEVAD